MVNSVMKVENTYKFSDKQKKSNPTIRDSVLKILMEYFEQLDGQNVSGVYEIVLSQIELPLLEFIMEHVNGNQTKAAQVLGINRATLRKKIHKYNLEN